MGETLMEVRVPQTTTAATVICPFQRAVQPFRRFRRPPPNLLLPLSVRVTPLGGRTHLETAAIIMRNMIAQVAFLRERCLKEIWVLQTITAATALAQARLPSPRPLRRHFQHLHP